MPRRLLLAAGCLAFLAFAAYGSFVPFRLEHISIADAIERFRAVGRANLWTASRTDMVANVLLFVPIGFTLAGAVADRSKVIAWMAIPLVALVALAASIGIEFGQVFIEGRTPSWNDVVAETVGAVGGAVAWALVGSRAMDWLRPLTDASTPLERARRLLGLYALVWVVLQILPLDFTLRLPELAEKYRAGRIVVRPFADTPHAFDAIVKLGGGALQALPIGALAFLTVRPGRSRVAQATLLGILAVGLLEAMQLLVVSRTANMTDVIAGSIGVVAGAWCGMLWMGGHGESEMPLAGHSPRVRPWAALVLVAWVAVLVVRHWTPFNFEVTRAVFDARVHHLYEIPFRHYYWGRYLDALAEAFTKVLLGVPVGLLLQIFWTPSRRPLASAVQTLVFVSLALALFTVIELGQLFLPSRVPDITDILLGVLGTIGGILAVRLVGRAG